MALTYQSTTFGSSSYNTTLTVSVNIPSMTNGIIVAQVSWLTLTSAPDAISSVAGATNTLAKATGSTGTTTMSVYNAVTEHWYKVNPTSVTENIVVTWPNLVYEFFVGYQIWSGGNAVSAGNVGNNNGSSTGPAVTVSSAAGNVVLSNVMAQDFSGGTSNLSSSDTERWKDFQLSAWGTVCGGSSKAGAASTTLNWTLAGSQPWSTSGFEIVEAGGASFSPGWAYGATKTVGGVF